MMASKLERDELVRSRWEAALIAQRDKRPARRYYEITDSGRSRLEESLAWLAGIAPASAGKA